MPFDREQFTSWYSEYERQFLRRAADEAKQCLNDVLDRNFQKRKRDRFRLGQPRIKSANRAFQKLSLPKYSGGHGHVQDVPSILDDLIGIRITCTNNSDVDEVREVIEGSFKETEFSETSMKSLDVPFAIQKGSHRDYIDDPKPSGYRAFHLNLMIRISKSTDSWEIVRVELQIRTLLQDSWGELTHEDTYKPGDQVGELVETLSRRMSEMFVVLDDIAQDLKNELDKNMANFVGDLADFSGDNTEASNGQTLAEDHPTSGEDGQLVQAVKQYIRTRYEELKEPLYLASLAWDLQGEFGSDITTNWLGYGKMAALLGDAVPTEAIVGGVPGLLIPKGMDAAIVSDNASLGTATIPDDVPDVAKKLKFFDTKFPLLSSKEMDRAYSLLAAAHEDSRTSHGPPDLRYLNVITKMARDCSSDNGHALSRSVLNYIGMVLLWTRNLERSLNKATVAKIYTDSVVRRMKSARLLEYDHSEQEGEIRVWLMGDSNSEANS